MHIGTLSIIIPVFNEQETVVPVLERVLNVTLPPGMRREVIVVNDASTDESRQRVDAFLKGKPVGTFPVRLIHHERNTGKGGAVQTGISEMTGDYLIIQDADLELDPSDFSKLLQPVLDGSADVVYGSRFLNGSRPGSGSRLSYAANRTLTILSNAAFGTRLTDMETCYKLLPADGVRAITLKELRFGFEPEITAKMARGGKYRITEVPISYSARTGLQGKKIGWRDGFRALYCIWMYGFLKR